ncbi:MAG: FtsW/RodA/SpoVE family cell cycle protein, partial [Rickettsia endosymbiont of Ixodes ricinus]|nr:FtsW/RodA/SpoVE family cell cycle protein [Rickettsia endosymbiont of Ixodes ricinus]
LPKTAWPPDFLLPVVGVPLPFISYGGTMITSMLIGFGLVMNAQVHRHTALKKLNYIYKIDNIN